MTSFRFAVAAALFVCALIQLGAKPAKQREVKVVLTPLDAPSTMPAEQAAWPLSKDLPALWGYFPRPDYPRDLEKCGISGNVSVQFAVNQFGWVVHAEVLHATDLQFANTLLAALRWHAPNLTGPPMAPRRYELPLTFSATDDSNVRDKSLRAVISENPPVTESKSFSRKTDFNPTFPGGQAAHDALKIGMSELTVRETIGPASVILDEVDRTRVLFYGNILNPELAVSLNGGRVTRIRQLSPKKAPPPAEPSSTRK